MSRAQVIPNTPVFAYQPPAYHEYPTPFFSTFKAREATPQTQNPKAVAPIFVQIHAHATTPTAKQFSLEFTPMLETQAYTPVYLLEFSIQGVRLETPSYFLTFSSIRMNTAIPEVRCGSDLVMEGAQEKLIVTCNEIPNLRASRSFQYPARYLGTIMNTGLRNMDVTVEAWDFATKSFVAPWVQSDDDLPSIPYVEGGTTVERLIDRTMDITLMIMPQVGASETLVVAS